jgi:hypothetical protein
MVVALDLGAAFDAAPSVPFLSQRRDLVGGCGHPDAARA